LSRGRVRRADVREIVRWLDKGLTYREVAELVGVSTSTVCYWAKKLGKSRRRGKRRLSGMTAYQVKARLLRLESLAVKLVERVEKLEAEVREIREGWLRPTEETLNELCEKVERLEHEVMVKPVLKKLMRR